MTDTCYPVPAPPPPSSDHYNNGFHASMAYHSPSPTNPDPSDINLRSRMSSVSTISSYSHNNTNLKYPSSLSSGPGPVPKAPIPPIFSNSNGSSAVLPLNIQKKPSIPSLRSRSKSLTNAVPEFDMAPPPVPEMPTNLPQENTIRPSRSISAGSSKSSVSDRYESDYSQSTSSTSLGSSFRNYNYESQYEQPPLDPSYSGTPHKSSLNWSSKGTVSENRPNSASSYSLKSSKSLSSIRKRTSNLDASIQEEMTSSSDKTFGTNDAYDYEKQSFHDYEKRQSNNFSYPLHTQYPHEQLRLSGAASPGSSSAISSPSLTSPSPSLSLSSATSMGDASGYSNWGKSGPRSRPMSEEPQPQPQLLVQETKSPSYRPRRPMMKIAIPATSTHLPSGPVSAPVNINHAFESHNPPLRKDRKLEIDDLSPVSFGSYTPQYYDYALSGKEEDEEYGMEVGKLQNAHKHARFHPDLKQPNPTREANNSTNPTVIGPTSHVQLSGPSTPLSASFKASQSPSSIPTTTTTTTTTTISSPMRIERMDGLGLARAPTNGSVNDSRTSSRSSMSSNTSRLDSVRESVPRNHPTAPLIPSIPSVPSSTSSSIIATSPISVSNARSPSTTSFSSRPLHSSSSSSSHIMTSLTSQRSAPMATITSVASSSSASYSHYINSLNVNPTRIANIDTALKKKPQLAVTVNAKHYTDRDVEDKLRLLTSSEAKFDELIEFGFPIHLPSSDMMLLGYSSLQSQQLQQSDSNYVLPPPNGTGFVERERKSSVTSLASSCQSTRFNNPPLPFIHPASPDILMKDEDSKLSINTSLPTGTNSTTMSSPISISMPSSVSNTNYTIETDHSSRSNSLVHTSPRYSSMHSQVSAVPREMTLKFTLTPPAMRADEAVLYGWVQASSPDDHDEECCDYDTSLGLSTSHTDLEPKSLAATITNSLGSTFNGSVIGLGHGRRRSSAAATTMISSNGYSNGVVDSPTSNGQAFVTNADGVSVAPGVKVLEDKASGTAYNIPVGGFGKDTSSKKVIMKRVFGKLAPTRKKNGSPAGVNIITSADMK